MKLLITRPEEDANSLVEKLHSLGHSTVMVPLLAIVPRPDLILPLQDFQLTVITSANAFRCALDLTPLKNQPCYAVGPQSLAEAQRQGFRRASAHGGDVHGLVDYIQHAIKPDDGPILYLSGAETSSDLAAQLRKAGYTVERLVTYDALPQALPLTAAELNTCDGVLLYSPRTARLWASEIRAANLTEEAARCQHYCLSANVAAALPQNWPRRVAAHPHETAIFDLLDQSTTNE